MNEEKNRPDEEAREPDGEGEREFRLPADPEALAQALRRLMNGDRE